VEGTMASYVKASELTVGLRLKYTIYPPKKGGSWPEPISKFSTVAALEANGAQMIITFADGYRETVGNTVLLRVIREDEQC
jgi:hypothetical protein